MSGEETSRAVGDGGHTAAVLAEPAGRVPWYEAMLMEDTSSVMDWLSPVPLGLRNGRQGGSGRVARHSTFTGEILTQLPPRAAAPCT